MGWQATIWFLIICTTTCYSALIANNTIDDMNTGSSITNHSDSSVPNNNGQDNDFTASTLSTEDHSDDNNENTNRTTSDTSIRSTIAMHDVTTNTAEYNKNNPYEELRASSSEVEDIFRHEDTTRSHSTTKKYGEAKDPNLPAQDMEKIGNIDADNVIQTTHGSVKGFYWRDKPDIVAYLDIPYGMFEGHFKPPGPPEEWEGMHEVTEHKKICPQLLDDKYTGDLNCLTLSIFTPVNSANASVLFHIHESHFVSGSGNPALYGPEHLVSRGIILVIPNYRLGPLGFLCLRNETAPGNAALKDLTLALNWTKNNINAFGGNPFDITLSGDGSAGALVGYLALSPKSRHYVTKAITESGSVLSYLALDRNPLGTAEILAKKIRNGDASYNNVFAEAGIDQIVAIAKDVVFKPCIDYGEDSFMEDTPWNTIHQEEINITFLMGCANFAGARAAFVHTEETVAHLNEDYSVFLPNDLKFTNNEDQTSIGKRIKALYFPENAINVEHIKELALYYTDASYLGPVIRLARSLLGAGATVYLYEFSFVGELNRELVISKTLDGAVKGDLAGYIFTKDGITPVEDTKEKFMVNLMADLWTNFIKSGTPSADNIKWDPLSMSEDSEEVYLSISTQPEEKRGVHVNRMRTWTEIYNEHFVDRNKAYTYRATGTASIVLLAAWLGLCKHVTQQM